MSDLPLRGGGATFGLGVAAGAVWGVLATSCAVLEKRPPPPPALVAPALLAPLPGLVPASVLSRFDDPRSGRVHGALDLAAPRGTPIGAVGPGRIARLPRSGAGGLAVEQLADDGSLCFYYAHLDRHAEGLRVGQRVGAGHTLGFVGSTGNAPAPHLHLAVLRLRPGQRCWEGTPIDPYPLLFAPG